MSVAWDLLPSCFGEFNRSWVGGRTVPSRSVSLIWQSVTTKWSDIDYRLSTKSHWKGLGSRRWRKSSPAMQSGWRDFLTSESGSLLHASQIRAATPTEYCTITANGKETFHICNTQTTARSAGATLDSLFRRGRTESSEIAGDWAEKVQPSSRFIVQKTTAN